MRQKSILIFEKLKIIHQVATHNHACLTHKEHWSLDAATMTEKAASLVDCS